MTLAIPPADLELRVTAVQQGIRRLYDKWRAWRDDPLAVTDAEWDGFVRQLEATDNLDKGIRLIGAFTGCVWGGGKRCPAGGPMRCRGCAS